MRIISGSKRRLLLETPEGLSTRPTQDRIKETLFNMIGPDVYDCRFLDLFAGSGQMALEAISRGACEAVLVEQDKKASDVISRNIKKCGFENETTLMKEDVMNALKKLNNHAPFDFVFMDPPYNHELEKNALIIMKDLGCISEDSLIIVEASLETDFSYIDELGFSIAKEKTYKTNKHLFIKRA